MMPNVQNDALASRRYSSIPAPMIRVDRVWKTEMEESHNAANRHENRVISGPGYPDVLGESPNRTNWASMTDAHTITVSVIRSRIEYLCCQREAARGVPAEGAGACDEPVSAPSVVVMLAAFGYAVAAAAAASGVWGWSCDSAVLGVPA